MGWFNHQLARDIFVSFFCYFGFESFRLNICSIGCMTPSSKLISWTKRLPPLVFFGGFQLPQRQLFGKAKKKPKPKWELGKAKNKLTIDLFFFGENIPVISYTTYTNTELDATPPPEDSRHQQGVWHPKLSSPMNHSMFLHWKKKHLVVFAGYMLDCTIYPVLWIGTIIKPLKGCLLNNQ